MITQIRINIKYANRKENCKQQDKKNWQRNNGENNVIYHIELFKL